MPERLDLDRQPEGGRVDVTQQPVGQRGIAPDGLFQIAGVGIAVDHRQQLGDRAEVGIRVAGLGMLDRVVEGPADAGQGSGLEALLQHADALDPRLRVRNGARIAAVLPRLPVAQPAVGNHLDDRHLEGRQHRTGQGAHGPPAQHQPVAAALQLGDHLEAFGRTGERGRHLDPQVLEDRLLEQGCRQAFAVDAQQHRRAVGRPELGQVAVQAGEIGGFAAARAAGEAHRDRLAGAIDNRLVTQECAGDCCGSHLDVVPFGVSG